MQDKVATMYYGYIYTFVNCMGQALEHQKKKHILGIGLFGTLQKMKMFFLGVVN